MGNQGTNPRSGSTVADLTSVVHRCPPVIHRISTGFVPRPVDDVATLPARRPQNLQQAIHTRPQDVDRDVTHRVCPHRFPQELSTSVGSGSEACPPLGINPCERLWTSVDNVGTKPSRPYVDRLGRGVLRGWGRSHLVSWAIIHRLWEKVWKTPKRNPFVYAPVGNPFHHLTCWAIGFRHDTAGSTLAGPIPAPSPTPRSAAASPTTAASATTAGPATMPVPSAWS